MAVEFTSPSPIRGDIKLLGSGAGILTATAISEPFQIANFILPPFQENQKILIFIDSLKSAGSADFNTFGTNETANINPTASPGFIKLVSNHVWTQSEVIRSITGNSQINFYTINSSGGIVTGTDNTTWGNITAQKTIYINMLSSITIDYYYKWAVYLLGDDVK